MSTSPLGAENTAAVKVQQGLSRAPLAVWPDPHDAQLGTPEPQEGDRPTGGAERHLLPHASTWPSITGSCLFR